MYSYPKSYFVSPPSSAPRDFQASVPGSKSLTNRALVVAALSEGTSELSGALDSDDTQVMLRALETLGVSLEHDQRTAKIRINGVGGAGFPVDSAQLDLGNSGTSLRFLAAAVASGKGVYTLEGNARMHQRPIADLLIALNRLGADAKSNLGNGCPPITIRAVGLQGGWADVRSDASSQFLSGLLMALPLAKDLTTVEVQGKLVSKPYVEMTLSVMEAFGVRISNRDYRRFNINPASYKGRAYQIEPDASAASYFWASAAVSGGSVAVLNLGPKSIQGDIAFVDVLEHMGCRVERTRNSIAVHGSDLVGVDVDMNAISDTVMTLAVVALFAKGVTRIRNVAHIRHKETDRIAALACELRKFGATVDEFPDGLLINPPEKVLPAEIATYDDHRMAMSTALAGLKVSGVVVQDPGCVSKTYPAFWEDFAKLGVKLVPVE